MDPTTEFVGVEKMPNLSDECEATLTDLAVFKTPKLREANSST